jgi:hypothetical protein
LGHLDAQKLVARPVLARPRLEEPPQHLRRRFVGDLLQAGLNRFGLCYGDAALFVRRRDYEAVGGFRTFPLFEDLDLVSRLRGRGRFVGIPCTVELSSRCFEGRNFALVLAGWAGL